MPTVSFRDYAGSVSKNDLPTAHTQLQTLLGLTADESQTATAVFQHQANTLGMAFLAKAMGLRAAVESGTDDDIGKILVDCFGLDEKQRVTAVASVRTQYPAKSG
jgi:hypothetical protein